LFKNKRKLGDSVADYIDLWREVELDHFDKYWAGDNFFESDWYKFQLAVNAHRDDALDKLRPLYAQVGFV